MKKFIVFILLTSVFSFTSYETKASHYMGGDISVSIDANNVAIVTITVFRDINGSGFGPYEFYSYKNLNDTLLDSNARAHRVLIDTIFNPLVSGWPGGGLERQVFKDTLVLPSSGTYVFENSLFARPPSVNFNQGALYLACEIEHSMGIANQGISFNNLPIYTNASDKFSVSNLAQHPGADSVVHRLVNPRTGANTSPTYTPFFTTTTNPQNTNPVLNPITGVLTTIGQNPQSGNYMYAVEAKAYKNRRVISTITRELTYVPNFENSVTGLNPYTLSFTKPQTNLDLGSRGKGYQVALGDTLRLDSIKLEFPGFGVSGSDPKSYVDFEVTTTSGIALGTNATLTDTVLNSNNADKIYALEYFPDTSSNNRFEVINFRLKTSYAQYDYAFWIYVAGDTTIQYDGAEISTSQDTNGVLHADLSFFHSNQFGLPDTLKGLQITDANGNSTAYPIYQTHVDVVRNIPSSIIATHFTVALPNLPAGNYTASWLDCCRPNGLENVSPTSGSRFYIETNFTVSANSANTLGFEKLPLVTVPKDSLWVYDVSALKNTADSVYYSISDPLDTANRSIIGFQSMVSNDPRHFSFFQKAGLLYLNGSAIGRHALNIKAETFDNTGNKKSEINRDLFMEVVDSASLFMQVLTQADSVNKDGIPMYSALVGKPLKLEFGAYTSLSIDSVTNVKVEATGKPFQPTMGNAQLSVANNSGIGKKATLTWTPTVASLGQNVLIKIHAQDDQMRYTQPVLVKVQTDVSVKEFNLLDCNVFPNPVRNNLQIELEENGTYNFELSNEIGHVVLNQQRSVDSGITTLQIPQGINNGLYLLTVKKGNNIFIEKIQIVR